MKSRLLLAAVVALVSVHSYAGTVNEVPSCYAANKIEVKATPPAREIFVLVDQTTIFDEKLQNSIFENTWGYLGPNSAYTVVSFSAFAQGRYTEVVSAGTIEAPLSDRDRDATNQRLLKTFDVCMKSQVAWAKQHAIEAIKKSLAAASADLAKSDILAALKDMSARIKESPAKQKVLLMASDMLENSSVSSFYASNTRVRTIDPAKELAAAERANLIGDFGSARVFVIGAGLIGPAGNSKASYRETAAMNALTDFWTLYFEKANAQMAQFGRPALLRPITESTNR